MWKPGELPFSAAQTEEELWESIKSFDWPAYRDRLSQFLQKIDLLEDGHASERVADLILKFLKRY